MIRWVTTLVALLFLSAACSGSETSGSTSDRGLRAFESEDELTDFLDKQNKILLENRNNLPTSAAESDASVDAASPSAAPESITNNQSAGVDEGGIVKRSGDTLIVLRRGRIFTISVAGQEMKALDHIDAFPPGSTGTSAWYDELLVHKDRVIVVGYSYGRGGTEINRFKLDSDGQLKFEDSHHLRSNDYYSADNYASRLVGSELIFYTPLSIQRSTPNANILPSVKRWQGEDNPGDFNPVVQPQQLYMDDSSFENPGKTRFNLHSVTRCDLASDTFDCSATGIFAGASREFYVSPSAVYLWVSENNRSTDDAETQAKLYRLPLDGSKPSALSARGLPIDQFSFLEEPEKGRLNVLVTEQGVDNQIEQPRQSTGKVSLLQIPLEDFGEGKKVADDQYRALGEAGNFYEMENRYVGEHVVYGWGRSSADRSEQKPVTYAAALDGSEATEIALDHSVERIEKLGSDAVVVGSTESNELGFTSIALNGDPKIADVFKMPAADQGESRSHAYFYRPDDDSETGDSGTLGLPISRQIQSRSSQSFEPSASMFFLRRNDRRFSPAGELDAQADQVIDDACQASCVDWYGNARPIFIEDRVFALLGYELVEGKLSEGRISETNRLNYTP